MSGGELAEFHDELRAVARELLTPTGPLLTGGEVVAPEAKPLVQAGWPGLEVAEQHGGSGATFAEVAVVLEELGRAATASSMLGTVLAVGALQSVESSADSGELLAGVASGEVLATAALPGGDDGLDARPTFRIERDAGVARLHGRAAFVPDAAGADRILVVADDPGSGPVLVAARPGEDVEVEEQPVVDATRALGVVVADGTALDPGRCWPLTTDPRFLVDRAALAVAIDAVGIAGAALDATVAYAGDRQQFGRAIGSFQAVKHACANVAVELTISRRLVADAVDAFVTAVANVANVAGATGTAAGIDAADGEAATAVAVAVSMAKAHAVETAVAATGTALQLHGGIGYTWEHGLHVLVKRAALDRSLFGSPAAHRRRLSQRYAAMAPG